MQSNVWFCFSPPRNKIKTISNRRTCRKGRFFSHLLLHAWVWKEPGSCFSWQLSGWHPGCGEAGERCTRVRRGTLTVAWSHNWNPWWYPLFCWTGRSVCCHKLHPGAGSQAIQVNPKQVFSCEKGEETAGKTPLWIIFNPVSQDCLCPNVSLVPCSRGTRWSGLHLVN